MKFDDEKTTQAPLERALAQIRGEAPDAAILNGAADRVWSRLSSTDDAVASIQTGPIHGCSDFRGLIPLFIAKALPSARVLLMEDHVLHCGGCRKALQSARRGGAVGSVSSFESPAASSRAARGAWSAASRWGLAAAAVVGIVAGGLALWNRMNPAILQTPARVQFVKGSLMRIAADRTAPFSEGEELRLGEPIRTAKNSGALVRLADGSLIEMNERSELSLARRLDGAAVQLARGSIIVRASRQGSGHLYVATDDALVSVTGTVFSVNSATQGSRVSVIDGEVHVEHAGDLKVLRPGERYATHASLDAAPLEADFAWSRDADNRVALVHELAALGRDLDRVIGHPQPRHATRLLDSLPAGTLFYAAIPNISGALGKAQRIIDDRIAESEILRQWWESRTGSAAPDPELSELLEKIRTFGDHLGEEIVVTAQASPEGEFRGLLLLSELTRPEQFRAYLTEQVAGANTSSQGGPDFRIIQDPASEDVSSRDAAGSSGEGERISLWVRGDIFAASTSVALLRQLQTILADPSSGGFAGTSLHTQIAESYRDGAGWLFAADIQRLVRSAAARGATGEARMEALGASGVLDLQSVVLVMRDEDGKTHSQAALSFDRRRRGLASWIAAPAPMGALDFFSADATILAAFVVKDPSSMVDDLYGLLESANPGFGERLALFESQEGIHLRDDFAAPLGGELAFAIDGPLLPVPAWKVVAEVYDAPRLQHTIEWLVERLNRETGEGNGDRAQLVREEVGGRTFYALKTPAAPFEVHYVFVDGYLVAAPQRSLLERAIQLRESGATLVTSSTFRSLLPRQGPANFSGILYQNIAGVLGSVGQKLSPSEKMTPEEQGALAALASHARPTLGCVIAEESRIVISSDSDSAFGSELGALFGLNGATGLKEFVQESTRTHEPGH